jgi:serine/threonine-protein kinase
MGSSTEGPFDETRTYREVQGPDAETALAKVDKLADVELEPVVAGRYEVRELLGRGGMGAVFRVRDTLLGRDVALKVLGVEADEETLRRFEQEARVTAQLAHPAVIPIHDLGKTEAGKVFYTMRCIEGQTLRDLLEDQRAACWGEVPSEDGWSLFRLLQVFRSVCEAVASAHDRRVVHRDIKPSNVMVGGFGQVYVLDWGLAKLLREETEVAPVAPPAVAGAAEEEEGGDQPADRTHADVVVGTPAFMAPEQARGSAVDTAADVYALGGLLYSLLTGSAPRSGPSTRVLLELAKGTPARPPSELRPGIPDALEHPCLQALALDPEERPTAMQLADAVEDFLEGRDLSAAPPEEAAYLRRTSTSAFRRPSVAVDVVLLRRTEDGRRQLLLQRRANPPFAGRWVLPGTFVRLEESLEDSARRLLDDECGTTDLVRLEQVGTYGDPGRDPRARVITVVYVAEAPYDPGNVDRTDEHVRWFPAPDDADPVVEVGVELAFDHAEILRATLT